MFARYGLTGIGLAADHSSASMPLERTRSNRSAAAVRENQSRMPKVLQVLHSDENSGVEALAAMIGGDLARAGADVETYFLYPSFSAGKAAKLWGAARGLWHIFRSRPDMILTYQATASVLAGVAGRTMGCRLRVVHQTAKPSVTHPVSRWLDRAAGSNGFYTANIANSQATLAEFADYPAGYRMRMRLIEHGVTPPRPRTGRAATLARYQVPDDGAILFNAGRLNEQKAQQLIIRTLPVLPQVRLVLAGGGALEATYRSLAQSLGVSDRVHFLGYVTRDEVGDLLGAADVFVFPSVWETFGLAIVEAAMLGLPVVCTELPVLREVMSVDGASVARFVAPENTPQLAAAIADALKPGEAAITQDFAPGLQAKYSQERMFAAYRAMLWPGRD